MALAIDVGNTNIVLGGFEGETILFRERISTNHTATVLEYASVIKTAFEMHNISPKFLQFQKVVEYLDFEYKEILEKDYAEEFDFFKSQMTTRGIHSISVLANKNNKKQAKQFLKEYAKKEKLNQVLRCKKVSKAIKLECLILKWFGINVHLWLTPIYLKIRNRRRSS